MQERIAAEHQSLGGFNPVSFPAREHALGERPSRDEVKKDAEARRAEATKDRETRRADLRKQMEEQRAEVAKSRPELRKQI